MRLSSSLLLGRLVRSILRLHPNRNARGIAIELGITSWNLSRWTTGGKLPPRRRIVAIAQRLLDLKCAHEQVVEWVRLVHGELNEQAARKNGYGFFLGRSDRCARATSRRVPQ